MKNLDLGLSLSLLLLGAGMSMSALADTAALVDPSGLVVNTIVLDEGANYTPPDGLELVEHAPDAIVGGSYDRASRAFSPPPPPPVPAPVYTFSRFMSRFTDQEKSAFLSSNNIDVRVFLASIAASKAIKADDVDVVSGMATLVSVGIITQARSAEILSWR